MTVPMTGIDELALDLDRIKLRAATLRQSFPPSVDTALLGLIEAQAGWLARKVRAINEPSLTDVPQLDVAQLGRDILEAGYAELRLA